MTATEPAHADPPPDLNGLALFQGDQLAPKISPARRGRVRSTWRFPEAAKGDGIRRAEDSMPTHVVQPTDLLGTSPEPASASSGIDWGLVAAYRSSAAEELTRRASGALSRASQQEIGRAIIAEQLNAAADEKVQSTGQPPWTHAQQEALARAIFDALFGLGRLQPLVDDDTVENIVITGHDRVWLERSDGSFAPGPPVADSDAVRFTPNRGGFLMPLLG